MALFTQALDVARRDGKLLLVVFGATWCPWCKVMHAMLPGPALLGQAPDVTELGRIFHVVEIVTSAVAGGKKVAVPSGEAVLAYVLARTRGAKLRAVPFVAALDPADGSHAFARNLDDLQNDQASLDSAGLRTVLLAAHAELRLGQPAPAEPGWVTRRLRRIFGR